MGAEISVSAVIIEKEGGNYTANCPEFGVDSEGESSEEALENLKSTVQKLVREAGAGRLRMSQVKCLKFKVAVD